MFEVPDGSQVRQHDKAQSKGSHDRVGAVMGSLRVSEVLCRPSGVETVYVPEYA